MPANRRLRILHLITDLHIGGAENMLAKLVTAGDRQRFESMVVSMTDGGFFRSAIEQADVRVTSLGMRRGIPNPIALFRLQRLMRAARPDILQTWLYHADLLGLLTRGWRRTPRLAWNLRGSNVHMSKLSTFVVLALARLSYLPDVIVCNTETGSRIHAGMGYRPRRWEFIPNGFDLDEFHPDPEAGARLRAGLGLSADSLLVGLVARYDPMKDHANFLRAVGILAKTREDVHFVLIGRDVDPKNVVLSRTIAELDLDGRVHMLGERTDIPAVTAALDIATSSSAYGEGFPNAVGEAMACAVSCVVTDVGDSRVIVGDTGRVVPPNDPEALANAWRELLDAGTEGRRRLGAAARQRIEKRYSLPTVIRRYEDLYQQLAEGG